MSPSSFTEDQTLSIAIINHNGERYLSHTIDQIYENCAQFSELIVVDNMSSDGSIELLKNNYPEARIIERNINDGPGAARNLAIRASNCDLMLLLDNDVAPCKECVRPLIDALANFSDAVVAMPAILYHDRPSTVQFVGGDSHFLGTVATLASNTSVYQLEQKANKCTSIISAALLVDRMRLRKHQLFNESLFIYQEDHEAGYRCGVLGMGLVAVPAAKCLHREGTIGLSIRETGVIQPTRLKHNLLNRWYILATLYQSRTLLRFLPALICYEIVVLIGVTANGWIGSWVWATTQFVKKLPEIKGQRNYIRSARICDDASIIKGGPFPFNNETHQSRLNNIGQQIINIACYLNWVVAKPRDGNR